MTPVGLIGEEGFHRERLGRRRDQRDDDDSSRGSGRGHGDAMVSAESREGEASR